MKKTRLATILSLLLVCVCSLAAFTLTACDGGVKVSFSQTEINVTEGLKTTLVITVEGSEEKPSVESSDTSVATVALIGKMCSVTAVKEGTATVTASVGEAKATCTVHVVKDDTERVTVTLDGQEITTLSLEMGQEKTLTANASKGSPITWETTDADIATVENGKVVGVKPGEVTITAKVTASIKAEVVVTVTAPDGYEYYKMELGGVATALSTPDKWSYYASDWVFEGAEDKLPVYDNGSIKLSFSNNAGEWWATQLAYKQSDLKEGQLYKLTFNINTTAGGKITVNGSRYTLVEGDNAMEIYYTERFIAYSGADSFPISLQILFGVEGQNDSDIKSATVTIGDLVWTEYTPAKLKTPAFTLSENGGEYTVNITDENAAADVSGYKLNFYDDNNVRQGSVAVANGEKVDVSTVKNGTYTVKLIAEPASQKYINSDEATTENNTITVSKDTTAINNYNNGGQDYAAKNPGTWVYWNDQNWCGSTVTVNECYLDSNNAINLSYTSTGSCPFGMQLFYEYADNEVGKEYVLSMTINSTVTGTITINAQEFELKVGDNEISLTYTEAAYVDSNNPGASIAIQFGANVSGGNMITEGTFVLGNITNTLKAE